MRSYLQGALLLAAAYNILWGAWQVLFPEHLFALLGMPDNNYPMIWQGMGMIIGVYGLGYALAAFDYIRHWPIVAVGMLGKIFGPLGYVFGMLQGTAEPAFGYVLIFNDFIWWIPFGMMLYEAWTHCLPLTRNRTLLPS